MVCIQISRRGECHDCVNNFCTERCMYNRRLYAGKIKLGPPFNNRFALSKSSLIFFSICVFFHEHSRFTTWQQRKRESIYLIPFHHFHPLHRAITADSLPLRIDSSWARISNPQFPRANRQPLSQRLKAESHWLQDIKLLEQYQFFGHALQKH